MLAADNLCCVAGIVVSLAGEPVLAVLCFAARTEAKPEG